MARSREFDDAEAVSAARDLFWERGYASTSLAQLQAATGLSKSSLYETFGSKRALFQRAADDYLSRIIEPQLCNCVGPAGRIVPRLRPASRAHAATSFPRMTLRQGISARGWAGRNISGCDLLEREASSCQAG